RREADRDDGQRDGGRGDHIVETGMDELGERPDLVDPLAELLDVEGRRLQEAGDDREAREDDERNRDRALGLVWMVVAAVFTEERQVDATRHVRRREPGPDETDHEEHLVVTLIRG